MTTIEQTTTEQPRPTPTASVDWAVRAAAVAAPLAAAAAERDRRGELPREVYRELRAAGLTAALVPAALGGGGATFEDMGTILRTLARSDPAVGLTLAMHSHLVAAQVWRHRHGQDAGAVLAKVAAGAMLISTGASDWLGSSGRCRPVEGGYRISDRKAPASGCEAGDVLATSIRWDDAPDGPQVLHCSVPLTTDGVHIEQTWDTLGMRATGSHTVVLDDVFVPEAAVSLARPADRWHPVWNTVIGVAMPLIMASYLGVADQAVEVAVAARAGRTEPYVLQLLGEMLNTHTTASDVVEAMLRSAADLTFANTDQHASVTLSRKTVAADACIATVRLAMEASGGASYHRSNPLERLSRDVLGSLQHPLPRARQCQFSGRVALGWEPVAA